jgi:hypothetical protein
MTVEERGTKMTVEKNISQFKSLKPQGAYPLNKFGIAY